MSLTVQLERAPTFNEVAELGERFLAELLLRHSAPDIFEVRVLGPDPHGDLAGPNRGPHLAPIRSYAHEVKAIAP